MAKTMVDNFGLVTVVDGDPGHDGRWQPLSWQIGVAASTNQQRAMPALSMIVSTPTL